MIFKTLGADQTRALGRRLGKALKGLDLVCLYGTLGSGKTTLTQGIARGAGFRGRVMSPTFNLVRAYRARRWTIYHVDLYRVGSDETGDIGIEDCVGDPRGVCVVEWPEAARGYYPPDRLEARLSHGKKAGERRIAFKALGPRAREILSGLGA